MTWWACHYHIVWATKGRESILDDELAMAFVGVTQGICDRHGVPILAFGWMPDHVHLAFSVPPRLAVATVVQHIKGGTSRFLAKDHEFAGWQTKYGICTFGPPQVDTVILYVTRQAELHLARGTHPLLEIDGYIVRQAGD